MRFSIYTIKTLLSKLSLKEKLFLILLLQQFVYRINFRWTGQAFPGSFVLTVFFMLLALFLGAHYLRRLLRPLLWSLRNRLIVTYVFIGVVPLFLILAMVAIGLYLVMGQVATHLVSSEIRSRQNLVFDATASIAWEISGRGDFSSLKTESGFLDLVHRRLPGLQVILRTSQANYYLSTDDKRSIPPWSKPGYMGVVILGRQYYLAAHSSVMQNSRRVEAFAFEPLSPQLLSSLLPELGRVQFVELSNLESLDKGAGVEKGVMFRRDENGISSGKTEELMALPPAAHWWDLEINWWTLLTLQQWDSPAQPIRILQVVTRPTLVFRHIFRTFDLTGSISTTLKWLSLALFALLLAAVCISVYAGVRMTRSITNATADLDVATGKIDLGDFSHRIPIRSDDQLSKLALSFNQMTENIERLIVEVKEKEKLESELVIALEVQTQLFPKKMPRLKTLEVAGFCSPARVVSGDYFDFVPIDQRQTALAIGDISGKGISAALLMASIQSSLRAQLNFHGALPSSLQSREGLLSTAQLVAMLNQQLFDSTTAEKFASFFLGVYDEYTGRLLYTNAGHLPPILIRQGLASRLEVSGMVLGVDPNVLYDQNSIQLESGDLLVGFTDGLSEPENEYEEEFGDARLIDLLVRHARKPLDEIASLVTTTVMEWARNPDHRDDMTLILARRL
jgi:sigma-B regulation protein RsbU (phosphoserine phosphatase)